MTRIDKLVSLFPEKSDAMLITSEISIRYFTSFPYTDGCLLITRDTPYLITDFRYIEAAKAACPDFTVLMYEKGMESLLCDLFAEHSIKSVLYEDDTLCARTLHAWQERFAHIDFQPAGHIVSSLMAIKDESEYRSILSAQKIAEEALVGILAYLSPEMTEQELALELEYAMRHEGAEEKAFDIIAITGASTSLPHGVPQNRPLQKGFLTLDYGAKVNGYCSDMTRTLCLGKADEEMKKIYQTVLDAQKAALEAILNGERNCRTIDGIARSLIDKAGYAGCFGHGLGHGVGLRIHEAPRLSPHVPEDALLLPGHVVTVEPGIYLPGACGVRIEDLVYIRENGAVNLTSAPKELMEL